jgi:hypothetical protein
LSKLRKNKKTRQFQNSPDESRSKQRGKKKGTPKDSLLTVGAGNGIQKLVLFTIPEA